MTPRIFGVDYQFLSCGDVFTHGLAHAAADLGIVYEHAAWDAPALDVQVQRFNPDLLFVVHGRKFSRRWTRLWKRSAVWLLDEPYEVDDTASWSNRFDHVFINDSATLDRHAHASYLPVCYDPHVHRCLPSGNEPPKYAVGFIGGGNATRDRYLGALARAGLLSYVVGGTWGDPELNRLCLSRNIAPRETAALYRRTRIVVNIFRDGHHFNVRGTAATAMNPRIYEALACGALVVSEYRPEIDDRVPELPTFRSDAACVEIVRDLLEHPDRAEAIRVQCAARLAPHTYAARLQTVLATVGSAVAA
jgi:hypothetical protein